MATRRRLTLEPKECLPARLPGLDRSISGELGRTPTNLDGRSRDLTKTSRAQLQSEDASRSDPIYTRNDEISARSNPIESSNHGIVISGDPIKPMNHDIVIPTDPIESMNHEIVIPSDPIESMDHEIVTWSDPIESMSDQKINDDDSITSNCTSNVPGRGHRDSLVKAVEVHYHQMWNIDETVKQCRAQGEHAGNHARGLWNRDRHRLMRKFSVARPGSQLEIRSAQRS